VSSAVVIGASSGVGRALAERLAREGFDLVLVARDARDLEPLASDLFLRFGRSCSFIVADIGDVDWQATAFYQECTRRLGEVELLLVPAGGASADDVGAASEAISGVFATNFLGPARAAAAFGHAMGERGRGTIVLFSSIAAAAPRRRNPAYSAAKAALETYARGLRHALDPKGVHVTVIALGYVDTAQSYGQGLMFPVATPTDVANYAFRVARHGGKHYYPWFWYWVVTILRMLPWRVYARLSF
jgi:decaprenylphospho-beta-D-erythro-pentofuranosid-2-ulose 2-reductase